jgi:hypothetical protein
LACALLIYLPLISLPFVLLSAWITYAHLKIVGTNHLRSLKSFLPDRKTHRYTLKTQVTMEPGFPLSPICWCALKIDQFLVVVRVEN